MQVYNTKTMVIASAGTTSSGLELEAFDWIGIDVPTIDNATLTIQGSFDGTTYRDIHNSAGIVLQKAAGTGAFFWSSEDLKHCMGCKYIRIVAGAAQNGGARTFTVVQKDTDPR